MEEERNKNRKRFNYNNLAKNDDISTDDMFNILKAQNHEIDNNYNDDIPSPPNEFRNSIMDNHPELNPESSRRSRFSISSPDIHNNSNYSPISSPDPDIDRLHSNPSPFEEEEGMYGGRKRKCKSRKCKSKSRKCKKCKSKKCKCRKCKSRKCKR